MIKLETGETLVGVEVAKLARDAGYTVDCLYSYGLSNRDKLHKGKTEQDALYGIDIENCGYGCYEQEIKYYFNSHKRNLSAPTQSALKAWIKEKFNIVIIANYPTFDKKWNFHIKFEDHTKNHYNIEKFDTEQEALEAAFLKVFTDYVKQKNISHE